MTMKSNYLLMPMNRRSDLAFVALLVSVLLSGVCDDGRMAVSAAHLPPLRRLHGMEFRRNKSEEQTTSLNAPASAAGAAIRLRARRPAATASCSHAPTHPFLALLDSLVVLLMIWTVKASTFAYNVADGQALKAGLKLSERESTHTFRADRAITELPGPLAYFSYVFFFGGVLVGPCFEAKEFFDFVDGSLLRSHNMKSLPSSILPALRCVLLGFLMYVGIFIAGFYPLQNYVNTLEFGNLPFGERFIYFWIAITASRFKYYFACQSHTHTDRCRRTAAAGNKQRYLRSGGMQQATAGPHQHTTQCTRDAHSSATLPAHL